jgi:MoaA/NifB/PqqE/SkfB family radical SAM enzyme
VFRYETIELVHLELTTRCNALCPMCRRTAFGGVAPGLTLRDLSVDEIAAIFDLDFVGRLRQVDFCGVLGDPIAARSFTDALRWLYQANPRLVVEVYTNGGIRPAAWWSDLAASFKSLKVIFAIDGLAGTHEVYRRGTKFEKAVENARAFIAAGGRAQWDFLVFKHNEHQVEEARSLASHLGFDAFVPKFSGRFYRGYYENDPKLGDDDVWDRFPIHNPDGQTVGHLELPSNPAYVNPVYAQMAQHFERHGSLLEHWNTNTICCHVIENQSIFIAADGTIFPCCWTYNASLYRTVYGIENDLDNQVERLLQRCGGRDTIDGRRRSIREICESDLFLEIAKSWEAQNLAEGKLKICARMCGRDFSQFRGQFSDRRLEPGRPPVTEHPPSISALPKA